MIILFQKRFPVECEQQTSLLPQKKELGATKAQLHQQSQKSKDGKSQMEFSFPKARI